MYHQGMKRGEIMQLSVSEKIKIILGRKNMTVSDLAKKLNTSRQNLTNKFARNNFSEKELQEIAEAMDCSVNVLFKLNDTEETI